MTQRIPNSAGRLAVASSGAPAQLLGRCAILGLALLVNVVFSGCSARAGGGGNQAAVAGASSPAMLSIDVELSDEQLRQLQLAQEVLMSDSADITDEARKNAAALLIDLGAPESRAVLEQALASTNAPTLRAVLATLSERPADPLLLDATVGALWTAPPDLCDIVAAVLAAHAQPGLERVCAIAFDGALPPAQRIQAIQALGSFRSRDGLVKLMALLEPDRPEPREIIVATCGALQALTGMRLDSDPQRWREWWSEFREKPFADVLQVAVRRLNDQLATTERQNARLSELYADALREIYLLLPKDAQVERLARDLNHEMPQVRKLALERIDRLLRDQERLPDSVKKELAGRLSDSEPAHRRMAARLLDDSNYDGLRELLVTALASERDAATAAELLRVLVKRPTEHAADAALHWLSDLAAGPNAAALLVQLAHSKSLPPELADEALAIVRGTVTPAVSDPNAAPPTPPPSHARLLAVIGKERDLVLLEAMLDTGSPELRQSIAEGFALIGRSAPLITRAQDPVLYPSALKATVNGKTDIETLRRVVALTPTEQHRELWTAEISNLASKVPHDQIMTADEMLAGLSVIDARTRVQLLQRAVDLPPGELPASTRRVIVIRAGELLLALDEPTRALELLDSLDSQRTDDQVRGLSLRAAVLAGLYDRAQQIDSDPTQWIAILMQLVEHDDGMAVELQRQIQERFVALMDAPTRAAFDAVSVRVQETFRPVNNAVESETSANANATRDDESVTP